MVLTPTGYVSANWIQAPEHYSEDCRVVEKRETCCTLEALLEMNCVSWSQFPTIFSVSEENHENLTLFATAIEK